MYRESPEPSPHSWPARKPPSLAMAQTIALLEARAKETGAMLTHQLSFSARRGKDTITMSPEEAAELCKITAACAKHQIGHKESYLVMLEKRDEAIDDLIRLLNKFEKSNTVLLAAAKEAAGQLAPDRKISVFDFVALKHVLGEAIATAEKLVP